jgi:hypothetical protein
VIVTLAVSAAGVEAVIAEMPAVPVSLHMAALPEHVANLTPDGIGSGLPEAILPSLQSIVTASPLVSPSPVVRVKLLFDDDPIAIDIFPPAAISKSPVITLDVPSMLVHEESAVPAWSHMATLFEHVADPNGIGIERPEAMLLLLPSVVTAPPLALPSPEGRVKLLGGGDPETIDASPPVAPNELPAISSNASPMSVSAVPVSFRAAMLFEYVADLMPGRIGMELPEAMLLLLPSIVTAPLLMSPSPEVRVKLLVDGSPGAIGTSPPAASNESPAILLNSFLV